MTKDDEKDKPEPQVESGEKKPLTIDLSEDGDDHEDKSEPQQQGKSKSPDPRRKSDWRQFKESHEQTVAELRRQVEELQRRPPPPQYYQPPPQQQQAKGEDYDSKIQDLWDQQQVVLAGVPPDAAPEQKARAADLWRKLDRQRRALEAKADGYAAPPRDQDTSGIPPENQRLGEFVQDEFPEIASDKVLALEAEAEFERIMRRPGAVKSRMTVREACERVKTRHGIGQKVPGPTDLERSRYAATPSDCAGQQRPVHPQQNAAEPRACLHGPRARPRRRRARAPMGENYAQRRGSLKKQLTIRSPSLSLKGRGTGPLCRPPGRRAGARSLPRAK
jgi:hypothetical protein